MSDVGAEMSESRMDELEPLKMDLTLWINKVLGKCWTVNVKCANHIFKKKQDS